MIYEITYPARCKDCQYLKSQRFTTKKGTISRRNIYICEKNQNKYPLNQKSVTILNGI